LLASDEKKQDNKVVCRMKPNLDFNPQVSMMIDINEIKRSIVDGGSAINVMLESAWDAIGRPTLSPTRFTLKIGNQSKDRPMVTINKVLVNVASIVVHQDFAMLQMPSRGHCYSACLGREWLHATKAIQDWEMVIQNPLLGYKTEA